jgi:tetratricopeptide (TPR) repeat protein
LVAARIFAGGHLFGPQWRVRDDDRVFLLGTGPTPATTASTMQLTHESRRTRWLILLAGWIVAATVLFWHTKEVQRYVALVDQLGQRDAGMPTTPLRQVCPTVYADAQMWVLHALALQEGNDPQLRSTKIDNSPVGREVHWSSGLAWLIAGAGEFRHAWTGEPLPIATERTILWINLPLLLGCVILFSTWTARRAGAGAGLFVSLALLGNLDFYEGFSPNYADHHGLISAAILGLVLGAIFMVADMPERVDPVQGDDARRRALNAASFSGICGAAGMWVSAATLVPAIAIVGGAAAIILLVSPGAASVAAPALWRRWGNIGAIGSFVFYLLEYAPGHLGWRMEVNHPVYALAWWSAGELIATLAEWRGAPRGTFKLRPGRLVLALLALGAAPEAICIGGARVFAVFDPFVSRLSQYVVEGIPLWRAVHEFGWGELWQHFPWGLTSLVVGIVLVWRNRTASRRVVAFALIVSAGFILLAVAQVRWWPPAGGPQIGLMLAALAALAAGRSMRVRWVLVLLAVALLDLAPVLWRTYKSEQIIRSHSVSRNDALQPLFRDIAAVLRESQPQDQIVLLASPNESVGISYYGRFHTVGTLYWENTAGLRAAAEIFSAPSEDAARDLIRARGITHIALLSATNFLQGYFELLHPDKPADTIKSTFGYQLAVKRQLPLWLQAIPYRPPPQLQWPGQSVLLLKVSFDQTTVDALYHIALAELVDDKITAAEQSIDDAAKLLPTPQQISLYLGAGTEFYREHAFEAAVRLYRRGLSLGYAPILANNLAWILATGRDSQLRDGHEALRLAQSLAETSPQDPTFADTLAAAYAENGDFDRAVQIATQAISLAHAAKNEPLATEINRRLSHYTARQPWRQ